MNLVNTSKILVIAAHPDDEVLGGGGAIAAFFAQGKQVHGFFLQIVGRHIISSSNE